MFIFAFLLLSRGTGDNRNTSIKNYTYSSLLDAINSNTNENITSIDVIADESLLNIGSAVVTFKNGAKATISIPSVSSFMDAIHGSNSGYLLTTHTQAKSNNFLSYMPVIIAVIIIVTLLIVVFSQQAKGGNGGGGRVLSFGKSKAKILTDNQKTARFKDIAGLKEEKYELEEIVSFLKEPRKFQNIGARIPKGILLIGPPGTGKTLLARAIAGEANVAFFSISGSDFVEMFVGVGASRVRDMFEEAKKNKPCLIFIDEIDAVGRRRGSGLGGGHDEREQTLNQLLVEMDGFATNEGIIIIAATNRVDILDPALLRPGRFDRQIYVGVPDVKGREDILKVHARNKKIDESINFKEIAKITSGFTGAELENLLNEAAILAAKDDNDKISMEDIKKSFIKVGIGTEKKSSIVSLEEKKITAYHEAGHAIITEALPHMDNVHIISIIPTGSAGGYTMHLPADKSYISKSYLTERIVVLFGGRIAEELIFGEITTGASNDIKVASDIAKSMVYKYGMSDVGMFDFTDEKTIISQQLASDIDNAVSTIIDDCYKQATKILKENMEYLHNCANLLLENEKISGDEFRNLFPKDYFPKKVVFTFPEDAPNECVQNEDSNILDNTEDNTEDNTTKE